MNVVREIIAKEAPSAVISVGDRVSRNLEEFHMNPKLTIIDNKCMRKRIRPQKFKQRRVVNVSNPEGTITEEAIAAVKAAIEMDTSAQIIVNGEEDLLTLVTVVYAPENSLVIYGQPREGIVVVRVTSEKKAEAGAFLEGMKKARKAK
jgi:uncharacterized protein (UPF0218 family)